MTWIAAADPLAIIAIQSGQVNAPTGSEAPTNTQLDAQQRFIALGEPVPIVFARCRNDRGGILISPGASEARFTNDESNNVTASYHLPISEGQIGSIAVKDVFQRACRVGSHTQTYNRRAGSWAPGNFLVQRAGKNLPTAPFFCGSVGLYSGISTLSFSVTIPDGFDQYNRQVHLFIRGGMYVTRIYDSVFGPSDNFADLVKWLMVNTSRVPTAMIDNAALTQAATFLEYNKLTCNCELTSSTNLSELLAGWAPYFLLGESNDGGKKGLRPLLPTTATGAINTGAIVPEFTFTEDLILPGTIEINYLSLADRLPFVAQIIWRQQLDSDIGITRTAEVRYTGTAASGPYESHDLSAFCTNETHAVKVGAYILAKRFYPTHVIRFTARPQAHNVLISVGDIISVDLQRQATNYVASSHHYLYQVERIAKTLAGDVTYEATHFPVDNQNRSLIALDVAAAVGTGMIIPNIRTGVTCDSNSATDNSIPSEEYIEPGDINDPTDGTGTDISTGGWEYGEFPDDGFIDGDWSFDDSTGGWDFVPDPGGDFDGGGDWGFDGGGTGSPGFIVRPGGNNNGGPREDEPDDEPPNDDDDNDQQTVPGNTISGSTGTNGSPQVGDTLTASGCVGAGCETYWYAWDVATGRRLTPTLGTGAFLAIGTDLIGKGITTWTVCPDSGLECTSPVTPPVVDLPYNRYNFVRAVYTIVQVDQPTTSSATPWFRINGGGSTDVSYLNHRTGPLHITPANTGGPWSLGSLPMVFKSGAGGGYGNEVFVTAKHFKDGTVGYTGVLQMQVNISTIYYGSGTFLAQMTGYYEFSYDGVTTDYTWNGFEAE
jgi:hypothetical protein